MPLGLHARIDIEPRHIMTSRWAHDMANALCRARLKLDLDWRYRSAEPARRHLGADPAP